MSQSRSSKQRSINASVAIQYVFGYVILVSIIGVFIALRLSLLHSLLVSTFLVIAIDVVLAFRKYLELFGSIVMFIGINLLSIALRETQLNALCFLVDPLLGLSIVLLIASYKYIDTLREVFTTMTPFVILVSTLAGIYLGIDNPIRYLLLTVVDVISSSMIYVARRRGYGLYAYSALNATMLYTSPLTGDFRPLLIGFFMVLHFARNVFMFSEDHYRRKYSGLILNLDLMLKPFMVRFI